MGKSGCAPLGQVPCTGGVYAVSGTIGQADAGTMSGGNYTLQGGFWGVVAAVQTAGAPYLSVTVGANSAVIVSWPLPADGFLLTKTSVLATNATWTTINPPYVTNGSASVQVTYPAAGGNLFFRLAK